MEGLSCRAGRDRGGWREKRGQPPPPEAGPALSCTPAEPSREVSLTAILAIWGKAGVRRARADIPRAQGGSLLLGTPGKSCWW